MHYRNRNSNITKPPSFSFLKVLLYIVVIIEILIIYLYIDDNPIPPTLPEVSLCEFEKQFCFEDNINNNYKPAEIITSVDNGSNLNAEELAILGALSQSTTSILEFGSGNGRSTWAMAMNSYPDTKILTINMPSINNVDTTTGNSEQNENAESEVKPTKFFFDNSNVIDKIRIQTIDSQLFNEDDHIKEFGLIFINGKTDYSYIKNDSEKAFKMLATGGIIVWGNSHESDVIKYLDEISKEKKLSRFSHTQLAVYKSE